jgi:hypothetical protein
MSNVFCPRCDLHVIENAKFREALSAAKWCVDYMASGMTHAPWVTQKAKETADAIHTLMGTKK